MSTVKIRAIVPDQRTPEEVEAWWVVYWVAKILQMYGPECLDEAMRKFHAARVQTESETQGRTT